MNLQRHPDLLDELAASYALGTLRAGARRRFAAMARENPAVRARALLWQENLAGLTELLPEHVPSPNVWKRIENQLQATTMATSATAAPAPELMQRLRRALGLWRGAAFAGGLATAAAVLVAVGLDHRVAQRDQALAQAAQQGQQLAARLQATPSIEYVAVLSDEQHAASMLVTFDPVRQSLTLKRVGGFQEASDRSLQLWALPQGGTPQSLGVLGSDPLVRLTAAEGRVAPVPALAISLEPKGGAPAGSGPTGPVLFSGPLLKTTL